MTTKKSAAQAAASADELMNRRAVAPPDLGTPPSNWVDVDERAAGYWNSKVEKDGPSAEDSGPICGTVVGARSFMNRRNRETTVFLIRLDYPCVAVQVDGDDREFVTLKKGDLCGVFESAGLMALRQRANCRVWIKRNGFRSTPNGDMKAYQIKSPDAPSPIVVQEFKAPEPRGKEADDGYDNSPPF